MRAAHLISEARKRAGLTQTELARRLDSHPSVIARWETGRTEPNFAAVVRAVRATGFEPSIALHPVDDHDLTLIRRELTLSPHQRLAGMVEAVNAINQMAVVARG